MSYTVNHSKDVSFPNCIIHPDHCLRAKCPLWKSFEHLIEQRDNESLFIYERYDQCLLIGLIEKQAADKFGDDTISDVAHFKDNYRIEGSDKRSDDPDYRNHVPEMPF